MKEPIYVFGVKVTEKNAHTVLQTAKKEHRAGKLNLSGYYAIVAQITDYFNIANFEL